MHIESLIDCKSLNRRRVSRGISIPQLAKMAKTSYNAVSNCMKGRCSLQTAWKVSTALGLQEVPLQPKDTAEANEG